MQGLREWAVTVCTAAVLCTLLHRLFPDTSVGRQGRLILPCVFVCALLSPVATGNLSAALPSFTDSQRVDSAALEARLYQQTAEQVNAALLSMANQALTSYGFEAKKVAADMDIAEDGSISMGQITVFVDEENARHAAAVKQIVERRLGTAVVLVRWEETG